jgi:hypothetical protein
MKVSDAKSRFIAYLQQSGKETTITAAFSNPALQALELLASHFANHSIDEITVGELRDFLARWYVEEASAKIFQQTHKLPAHQSLYLPPAQPFIETLSAFFKWHGETSLSNFAQEHLALLSELQETLPRAIEISVALMKHLANRGGAIQFPEFLTSFEAGGHSEYDIGTGGAVGAIEGYFRVLRREGVKIEAEELISETPIYPIIFPASIAGLLQPNYLINLEIVHTPDAWQIVNCGFAYPPNTEI